MASKLVDKVIEQFTRQITDQIFCMIQNDRDLFKEYNALSATDKKDFNRELGKEITARYDLKMAI